MLRAHTVEDVRRAEAAAMARLPAGALMQRAAAGLAAAVLDLLAGGYGRRVLLLVGPGDNGGDALWAGARLAARGSRVEALLLADRVHELMATERARYLGVLDALGIDEQAPERLREAARRIDDLRFAATPTPLFEEGPE